MSTTPQLALLASVVLAATAAGCAKPSERIATALGQYGLERSQAECVGDALEENLSIAQLRQLGDAARAYSRDDKSPGRLTFGDLVRVAAQIRDARVPLEVGRAAVHCGVIDRELPLLR